MKQVLLTSGRLWTILRDDWQHVADLTRQERNILTARLNGYTFKQIGKRLGGKSPYTAVWMRSLQYRAIRKCTRVVPVIRQRYQAFLRLKEVDER